MVSRLHSTPTLPTEFKQQEDCQSPSAMAFQSQVDLSLCVHRTVEQVTGHRNEPLALFYKMRLYSCGCKVMLLHLETYCLWSYYLVLKTEKTGHMNISTAIKQCH